MYKDVDVVRKVREGIRLGMEVDAEWGKVLLSGDGDRSDSFEMQDARNHLAAALELATRTIPREPG